MLGLRNTETQDNFRRKRSRICRRMIMIRALSPEFTHGFCVTFRGRHGEVHQLRFQR